MTNGILENKVFRRKYNKEVIDALKKYGYSVNYKIYNSEHDFVC